MARSFQGRSILGLKDMERHEYFTIFETCDKLAPFAKKRQNCKLLENKTLLTAFYQPSTRTRLSTEAAMHRLGGHVLGFADPKMTRAGDFYLESIKDTFNMLEYYGDVIACRHFAEGAPREAAKHVSIPIINCGDGWGEHPTQVLTDLYTIYKEKGTIDGLTFICVGDMRMRTMHSIAYALSKFDVKVILISPPSLSLTPEFMAEVKDMGLQFRVEEDIRTCIHEADVIYMEPVVQADYTASRVDSNDAGRKATTPPQYVVNKKLLFEKAKPDSIVLHSLPRMDELDRDVDETRHQRYWVEGYNGVLMRMALLSLITGAVEHLDV